jgi:hypothetical protein
LYKTYWLAVEAGKSYKIMKKDKAQASNNQSLGFSAIRCSSKYLKAFEFKDLDYVPYTAGGTENLFKALAMWPFDFTRYQ